MALVALCRACHLEGVDGLRSDEIAVRVGMRVRQLDQAVVARMVERGWVTQQGPELAPTPVGRQLAQWPFDGNT